MTAVSTSGLLPPFILLAEMRLPGWGRWEPQVGVFFWSHGESSAREREREKGEEGHPLSPNVHDGCLLSLLCSSFAPLYHSLSLLLLSFLALTFFFFALLPKPSYTLLGRGRKRSYKVHLRIFFEFSVFFSPFCVCLFVFPLLHVGGTPILRLDRTHTGGLPLRCMAGPTKGGPLNERVADER